MHWQDLALTVASLVFIVALVPTVLSPDRKPALTTSVMNATVSAGIALIYLTLWLWFASVTTALNAVLWTVIGLQTVTLRRERAASQTRPASGDDGHHLEHGPG